MSSLRVRLALAFALVACLVAGIVGVVVHQLTAQDLLDRARARATANVLSAARLYPLTKPVMPYPALPADDPSVPRELRRSVAGGHVATFRGTWQGRPVIWAGRPAADGTPIFVRASYAAEQRSLDDLRATIISVALAAAAAGALAGLLLASGLSRRLRRAAAVAGTVAAGDLDARIGGHGRDEVAALGRAVDGMAEALQERIDREQRFVADVAHDLRTPVTGLVAAAALLEPDEIGRAIQDRARHLSRLVDDLLEIARLESGSATPDLRWVDVEALVREAAAGRDGIEVRGGEPCRALVDPRRLQRVVENLLGNAERHGRPPITVEISATQLAVADAGPGFPDDLLDRATERFATGDPARGEGIGLGLAIAAAQARVLGGRLELANRPEGGARAVVVLPRPMEAAP